MKRRVAGEVLVASVCLALALTLLPSVAEEEPSEPTPGASAGGGAVATEEGAIARDAQASGRTEEEIAKTIELNRAVTALRQQYGEDFTYARVNNETGQLEVSFKGDVPPGAREIVAPVAGVDILVNAGFSESELNQDILDVMAAVEAQLKVSATISAYENFAERTIEVSFSIEDNGLDQAELDSLGRELSTWVANNVRLRSGFTVNIEGSMGQPFEPEAADGGCGE